MSYVTRPSLLLRLRDPRDSDAWEDFHRCYSGLILSFALRRGCNQQMAYDVLQETMINLARVMPDFRYDRHRGQFRSFLLKLVHHHLIDAFRRERKYTKADTDDGLPRHLPDTTTRNPSQELAHDWDREWDRHLLLRALDRVRERLTPRTYTVFRQYVLEGRPVEEVCAASGLSRNTVYQHRARVIRMLRQEVAAIRQELGDEP